MAVVIYYGRSDLLCVVFLVWQGPLGKDPAILKILRPYQFTMVVAKNTTVAKHYGRVSETPCFPGETYRKSPQ